MYCLVNMCYVCLKKESKPINNINSSMSVNKDIIHILGYLPFNLAWMKTKQIILICDECCLRLRQFYQFQAMCLKNSALIQGYLDTVNTASISITDNKAELPVDLTNKHDDTNEIKLEEEEIDTFEREPIIEKRKDVFVIVDDSFIKKEDTWKMEEVEDTDESPVDNNFTANKDNKTDSEIYVNSNTHDTVTDSSEVRRQQVHTTNNKKLYAATNKYYTCSTCRKSFITKYYLKAHTQVHTSKKTFKCSRCGKYFSQSLRSATRIRVHTGAKPFQCSECDQCFKQSNLVSHMNTHSGT